MPGIDVMLPFYGDVDHLKLAVNSVLRQRYQHWALTVVDDCHPDPEVGRFATSIRDRRVRYLRNDTNLGVSANFQRCLSMVEADHFVIMGGDDVMLPNYLELVASAALAFPQVSLIQPGVVVIDDRGGRSTPLADSIKRLLRPRGSSSQVLGGEDLARSLLIGDWLYFPSLAWRTESLAGLGFRQDLEVVLDLALVLDVVRRGHELLLLPEVAYLYRRHEASVSSVRAQQSTRFDEERLLFEEEAARCGELGWSRAARAARWHVTSRANAVMHAGLAVRRRDGVAFGRSLMHAVR